MADFLYPLELQTIFMNIFAGDPDIFTAIALIVISSMAGYFRMTSVTLFFMVGLFLFMLSDFMTSPLLTLLSIFAGLSIGYIVSKFTNV